MNYGIVAPGPDVEKGRVTHLFNLRRLFTVMGINQPKISVLSKLVTFVNDDQSVTRPIENIFVGAHSNGEGVVLIQMAVKQKRATNRKFYSDYETLEAAVVDGSLAVNRFDDRARFRPSISCISRATSAAPSNSWRNGSSLWAPRSASSAPRFNHGIFDDRVRGVWEFMTYQFVVFSPKPLSSRDSLIQKFQEKHFTYLETISGPGPLLPGPPIPDEVWESWVPLEIKTKVDQKTGVSEILQGEYPQPRSFNVQALALPFLTMDVDENFTADQTVFKKKIPNLNPMPTTDSARMAALRTFFLNDVENSPRPSRYVDTHLFPMYRRFGYENFEAFIAGHTWHFKNKPGSSDLYVRGTRERYTTGVGIAVNAGPVHGGGFISFEPDLGRYSGAVELSIYDISVKAFGLIETKVPGVSFSFVIVISAEFTPIQLGFGFTLNGVGGLVGINRTINSNELGKLVREGRSENLLFPKNLIANAPTIIRDLGTVFPARQSHYVFGPLGKLGWGTPTLITGQIGIVLELPGPVIVLLGEIKVALPKPDVPLVKMNMSVVGDAGLPEQAVLDRCGAARLDHRGVSDLWADGAAGEVGGAAELRGVGGRVPPVVPAAEGVPEAAADGDGSRGAREREHHGERVLRGHVEHGAGGRGRAAARGGERDLAGRVGEREGAVRVLAVLISRRTSTRA